MRAFKHVLPTARYLILVSALLILGVSQAFAMGSFEPAKETHYFHSSGENWVVATGYYAVATITYDGETLKNGQKLTGRGGFGGVTTGKRKIGGRLTVKIELYRNDNTHVETKNWSGDLSGSWKGLSWRYTPPGASHWVFDGGFLFQTNGKTRNGSVDVKVG